MTQNEKINKLKNSIRDNITITFKVEKRKQPETFTGRVEMNHNYYKPNRENLIIIENDHIDKYVKCYQNEYFLIFIEDILSIEIEKQKVQPFIN